MGSSAHFCNMGTAKATVLPLPVLLLPIMSAPERIAGMQDFWMGVGRRMEREERVARSQGETERVAKLEWGSTVLPLWRVGGRIVEGWLVGGGCEGRGLMREIGAGRGRGLASSEEDAESDGDGESLRRFLEGPFVMF